MFCSSLNRVSFLKRILASVILSMTLNLVILSSEVFGSIEGSIYGVASDSSQSQAAEITIRLMKLDGSVVSTQIVKNGQSFRFSPVQVGDYQVVVQEAEKSLAPQPVHVSSNSESRVNASFDEGRQSSSKELIVQVKAKKRLIHNTAAVSSAELSQSEIKELPQGSEAGLPKLISSTTPGVVPGPFGQMFIRGNHANIQYQIDGIQMPESPSSTFGQSFSPRNIDHMEVITGGIPAEYGQRLGAVVNIITKSGPEKPSGEFELNYGSYNAISPHLLYGGSNEAGDFHYYIGLNYNQTDRGIDTPNPVSVDNQLQGGTESVHNRATGNNEFAKFDWQLDNSNKLSLVLFHAYNFFQIPNYPKTFSRGASYFSGNYEGDQFGSHPEDGHPIYIYAPAETNNTQAERNAYLQAVWKHTFANRSYFQLAPYYKYSSIVNAADPKNDFDSITTLPLIAGSDPVSFAQNRHANTLGVKGDYTIRPNDDHLIKTGFQIQTTRVEGGFSLQTDPNVAPLSNNDPMIGTFESLYVQDDVTLHKEATGISNQWVLNAGLRFDATQFNYSGINPTDYQFQPRVGVSYFPTEYTKLHLFYGRLFQPAPIENLRSTFNALAGTTDIKPFDIQAEKADFYELGVSQQVFDQQVISLNLFYKNGINFLDDAQLFRTPIAQPFNFAKGYAYGAELSLKGKISQDWSNYLNYSYLIAKASGISGGEWAVDEHELSATGYQNMDHAQAHTANAGITYSKNGLWWTTQAFFGSGLWTGHNNSVPLPSHITFDTTVGYSFADQAGWLSKWKVSVDVVNILDNRYPITIANSFNGTHYAAGRLFYLRLTKFL